jgi:hypothetical protein
MPNERPLKPRPPALPDTVKDFMSLRRNQTLRTLNDQVEEIHLSLYENEEYMAFLYAVYDEQAVEGSLSTDNTEAARIIRNRSRETGNVEVGRQKLATIAKSLGVVLRRYGQDRKTRRNTVHGEVVPNEDDNS